RADLEMVRLGGECGEERPALEAGTFLVAEDRDEVVEDPGAVVAERVSLLPRRDDVVPGRTLVRRLDAEPDARRIREGRGGEQERESHEQAGGPHPARLTHAPSRGQCGGGDPAPCRTAVTSMGQRVWG